MFPFSPVEQVVAGVFLLFLLRHELHEYEHATIYKSQSRFHASIEEPSVRDRADRE